MANTTDMRCDFTHRSEIADLTRERDEARAEAERYKALLDKLPNEADECRLIADNARLRALVEDILACHVLQYAQPKYREALARTPSDTLAALRELMAAAHRQAWGGQTPLGHREDVRARTLEIIVADPRLAWLRRT